MLFPGALVFWSLSLLVLTILELIGYAAPSEKEKLNLVGGTFAFAVLSSAVREACTSKERPIMFRLSVLLLVANIACILSDTLALDEMKSSAPVANSSGFLTLIRRSPKPAMRFATKHVVATLLALAVFYLLTALHVFYTFVRWRLASLHPTIEGATAEGGPFKVLVAYADIGSGHKMAALAVQSAFERKNAPSVQVVLVDVMDLCPTYFRYVFQTMFQSLTQSLLGQHVLGLAYDAADKGRAKSKMQKLFERFVSLALIERVARERPSVVPTTRPPTLAQPPRQLPLIFAFAHAADRCCARTSCPRRCSLVYAAQAPARSRRKHALCRSRSSSPTSTCSLCG